jgi:glycosyltransferase involved in cell wall biosynthesis
VEMVYRGNSIKVCAVIPAYNEDKTIGKVIRETRKYVDTVFVVDDGSTDKTAEKARENGAEVVQHEHNQGIGRAQQSGYEAAFSCRFDYIVQLDGDGQHNPEHIPEMLDMASSCDMVIASRFLNHSYKKYPLVRRLGISFFAVAINLLTGTAIKDVTSGYRVYRTESLKKLGRLSKRHWAIEQTLEAAKKGFSIKEASVKMPVRNTGRTQFSLATYILYPPKMIYHITKVMLFR